MKEIQKLKPAFDTNDVDKELKDTGKDISSWLTPPTIDSPPAPSLESPEKTISVETKNLPQNDPEIETTTSSSETGSANA